jgi:hypothetical protein
LGTLTAKWPSLGAEHQAMIYYDGFTPSTRAPVDMSSRDSGAAHTLRLDAYPSDCGLISRQLKKRGITIESDRLAILANSNGVSEPA